MKKVLSLLLIAISILTLTSCYSDIEENSLDDYIACINKNNFGYSSVEVDLPDALLPSISFLEEYLYINGNYHYHEDDLLRAACVQTRKEVVIISLKYDIDTYYQAKEEMFEKIKPYNDRFYLYNNYVFYENSNRRNLNSLPKGVFTMACYNDQKCSLLFIGCNSSGLYESLQEGGESTFPEFIEQYYGEYYDFNN